MKKMKNPFGEFLYLSFAVTRLKIGLTEKNAKKRHWFLHKTVSPALGGPRGHTLYLKIKVPPKPIKHRFTVSQNVYKKCFQKKNEIFR